MIIKAIIAAIITLAIRYNNQSVSVPKRPDIPVLGQDVLGRDMPQQSGCHVLKQGARNGPNPLSAHRFLWPAL